MFVSVCLWFTPGNRVPGLGMFVIIYIQYEAYSAVPMIETKIPGFCWQIAEVNADPGIFFGQFRYIGQLPVLRLGK